MNFHNVEFLISAANPKDFPKNRLPEIAFAGKSNVGKSSVINRILMRKNFARVGEKPGKTIHVNYFLIDRKCYLVDLPGYGFAKVSQKEKDRWGKLMEDYFAAILADLEEALIDEPVNEAPFTDIANHWGKDYINIAYADGFIKGYEDGTFKPNTNMTRVEVLSVIARAFELEATKPAPFKDISNYTQQTQNEIAAAYEAGLVRENEGYFNPKGEITRAQLALILMRLSNNLAGEAYEPEVIAPFNDIKNYDRETQVAITFLYDIDVVQGTSATTFSPKGNLTRAQFAKILVLTMSEE